MKLYLDNSLLNRPFDNLEIGESRLEAEVLFLIIKMKLQPIDAFHVASAEEAAVDFLITCDYNLSKQYQGKLKVISPLKFLEYYENPN